MLTESHEEERIRGAICLLAVTCVALLIEWCCGMTAHSIVYFEDVQLHVNAAGFVGAILVGCALLLSRYTESSSS